MQRQAIRNEGKPAEQAFLRLVKGSRDTDSAKCGDAIVTVDNVPSYVEIKHVTSNTINQVRAIKFIPLVIYSPQIPLSSWAVLPAYEVVRMVLPKGRGQHTEIALECANLRLNGIDQKFRFQEAELSDAIHEAIRAARRYKELATLLSDLLNKIRDLNVTFRGPIETALRDGS